MLADLGSLNEITSRIIGAAIEVHRTLGPGLLEAVYIECLVYELRLAGLRVTREVRLPVVYKGIDMNVDYILDLLIDDAVVVEVKAVERLLPVHEAQLQTQLKIADKPVGLLLNFNVALMKDGIIRHLNRAALEQTNS